jgi:outer membrane lipoprotein-sorting protein
MTSHKGLFAAAAMIAALGLATPAAAELSARQIVEKAWWSAKLDGAEMISTLTIVNAKGQKRVRKTASVSKLKDGGKTEKRLIRFLSPADVKGTGLLTYDYEKKDDDIWFFLPSLRKTRRIVSTEKSKNFMGSEFTYADITPPSVDDFKCKLLRKEKVGGTECYVVQLIPKTKKIAEENGYSKRVNWIGAADFVIRKSKIFDHRGKLHKELSVGQVKLIDPKKKRYRPMDMKMINKQDGRSSTMKVNKIKLRKNIPDKYFTTRFLERT